MTQSPNFSKSYNEIMDQAIGYILGFHDIEYKAMTSEEIAETFRLIEQDIGDGSKGINIIHIPDGKVLGAFRYRVVTDIEDGKVGVKSRPVQIRRIILMDQITPLKANSIAVIIGRGNICGATVLLIKKHPTEDLWMCASPRFPRKMAIPSSDLLLIDGYAPRPVDSLVVKHYKRTK